MKKLANESKLNIQISELNSGFAKELVVTALSFFISLSILNLAFVSLSLQKAGFSMVAIIISLVLIATIEIAISSWGIIRHQSSSKAIWSISFSSASSYNNTDYS